MLLLVITGAVLGQATTIPTATITLSAEGLVTPETYLVSCFIEDANSDEHEIHAALGIIQIVTITES